MAAKVIALPPLPEMANVRTKCLSSYQGLTAAVVRQWAKAGRSGITTFVSLVPHQTQTSIGYSVRWLEYQRKSQEILTSALFIMTSVQMVNVLILQKDIVVTANLGLR